MKVCVIGAGIVGCSAAYHLARAGHAVHLLDAGSGPGQLTSFANGAQLSYSYVEPFATPATLRSLPTMLLSATSPVRFRLRADWRQWTWLMQFLRACDRQTAQRGTVWLLELAQLSRRTLDAWLAEEKWDVSFRQNGKLVLCPDAATLRRQEAQVRLQRGHGCRQEVLSAADCLRKEPALGLSATEFAGGVWTADECVADPHRLCEALLRSLHQRGGTSTFGVTVQSFVREGSRFIAARSTAGDIHADAFVLAAGPHAAALASGFGMRLPIYPIKGYSITLPIKAAARSPQASVTDLKRKTVFAPLDGRMRVAAMAEITGYDPGIQSARVQEMLRSVEAVYPGLCEPGDPQAWAGLRPATPTSLPIIGRMRDTNMFFNVGHGALGLTLAAGSAMRLAGALQPA